MATAVDNALVDPCICMTQFTLTGSDQTFTFQPNTRMAQIIADAATVASIFFASASASHAGLPIPVSGQPMMVLENENLGGVAVVINGTLNKNVYILEFFSHK